jgi:dienelactone hydrolase
MAHVALFHSMLGLRPPERLAAERLRQAGHLVTTPDLYDGRTAGTMDEGYSLMNEVGWPVITQRARHVMSGVPADAVLMGFSMGVGVVSTLWPERPRAAAVVLLHALAALPANARPGLRLQVHAGENDDFAPPSAVAGLLTSASDAGVAAQVFTYPGAGHFYTDASLPEHDFQAADLTWQRILEFLR